MSDLALRVSGLGKRYRLGEGGGTFYRYNSLRDTLGNLARRPIKTLTRGGGRMTEDNSFWALKDVDFEVKRGEVVGIIGRNGAGKSTLLKILSRITKPTTGGIDLYGRVGSLLEVGTGFHPELSGRENVYLNGAILGMTKAEVASKFDEIVAFSEVEKFLDTPVKQYSSGMYMRLAFAVAAHLNPEILVVDEVLAVGDAEFQKKCLGKMKDVSAGGRTVLFVSHNMGAVRELCDSGCFLEAGRVRRFGPIDSVIRDYMTQTVAATEVEASAVRDQTFVGPGRIVRCGVTQPTANRDAVGSRFLPELPIRVYADVEQVAGAAVSLGVRIRTGLGQELLQVTSQDELDALHLPSDKARISIDLPSLPLNDGDYSLMFYLGDRTFAMQHVLNDAVTFTVDTSHRGSVYATSPMRVDSRWTVEAA